MMMKTMKHEATTMKMKGLRRAINRAQHLLESRHQISFAPPTSTMPLTSRKQS